MHSTVLQDGFRHSLPISRVARFYKIVLDSQTKAHVALFYKIFRHPNNAHIALFYKVILDTHPSTCMAFFYNVVLESHAKAYITMVFKVALDTQPKACIALCYKALLDTQPNDRIALFHKTHSCVAQHSICTMLTSRMTCV